MNERDRANLVVGDIADLYESFLSWIGHRTPVTVETVNGISVLVINTGHCERIGRIGLTPHLRHVYATAHTDMHMATSVTSWLAASSHGIDQVMVMELRAYRERIDAAVSRARDAALEDHRLTR